MKDILKNINEIHYKKKVNFRYKLAFFIPAVFYSAVILTKNALYKAGFLKETKCKPIIICVGNITTGGVGKTPIVCEIANYISNILGKKTAVLSRGYGGKLKNKTPNLIKDFNKILINNAALSGDEANVIAVNTQNAAVITCSNRIKGANFASDIGAQVVIMDDGFSNRTISKDLSIIVIDSIKQFGNRNLLPLGPLREPIEEINRAHKIIIVNKNKDTSKTLQEQLEKEFGKPVLTSNFIEDGIYNLKDEKVDPASFNIVNPLNIAAFCAIGQPEQFYNYLKTYSGICPGFAGFDVKETISYNDHHIYCQNDADCIVKIAKKNNVSNIFTTQKDAVKLKNLDFKGIDVYILKIRPNLDVEKLIGTLDETIRNL